MKLRRLREGDALDDGGITLVRAARSVVVRIVAVEEDGQVHFTVLPVTVLPGSLEKNRHLIGRALA